MSDETPTGRSSVSSAYTRIVGNARIDVINASQRPDDVPKSVTEKWAVIVTVGKRKPALVTQSSRKYDAIAALLAHETELKAAANDES